MAPGAKPGARSWASADLPVPDRPPMAIRRGDGALDLVGAVAGQEDHGAVGIDALDRAAAVARRVAEEARRLGLIFNHVVFAHDTLVASPMGTHSAGV